ncbi:Uncharacterised protein g10721 [Pycnogonum litorale]
MLWIVILVTLAPVKMSIFHRAQLLIQIPLILTMIESQPSSDPSLTNQSSALSSATSSQFPTAANPGPSNSNHLTGWNWKVVHGKDPLPTPVQANPPSTNDNNAVKQPIEYFRNYICDDFLNLALKFSNLYALQKNINKPLCLTKIELEQFLWVSVIYVCD